MTDSQPIRIDRVSFGGEEHAIDPPVVVEPDERVSMRVLGQYPTIILRRNLPPGRRYWWKPWKRRRYIAERQTVIYSAKVGSGVDQTINVNFRETP